MAPSKAYLALLAIVGTLQGCQGGRYPPMETVPSVDLPRFMGPWYVIASIPTALERGAHNAVETYELAGDGTIETTFRFNADDFDGPIKVYTPRGFVLDPVTRARWGMRFVWPIKADYRIIFLDESYSQTVIGRQKRDYVWIMARTPQIADEDYARLVQVVQGHGYDVSRLQKVPQQ